MSEGLGETVTIPTEHALYCNIQNRAFGGIVQSHTPHCTEKSGCDTLTNQIQQTGGALTAHKHETQSQKQKNQSRTNTAVSRVDLRSHLK